MNQFLVDCLEQNYEIIDQISYVDDIEVLQYGILQATKWDEETLEEITIENISDDKQNVEDIIQLLKESMVDPITLNDIVYDLLVQQQSL